jgi:hypothetical protein
VDWAGVEKVKLRIFGGRVKRTLGRGRHRRTPAPVRLRTARTYFMVVLDNVVTHLTAEGLFGKTLYRNLP